MTDLILGARLEADAGKLVGQLGASEAAARGLEGAFEQTGTAARQLDGAVDAAGNAMTQASKVARAHDGALDGVAQASRQAAAGADQLTAASRRQVAAASANIASAAAQRAGYQQLGFQMQDVFQQVALGINPMVILAQQGGQVAGAVSLMGGRMGQVAAFLSGPWGAAIFGAATILGFLVQGLLETDDAAKDAQAASYDFADGLNVLALSADQTSAAMRQLAQEVRSAIAAQGDFLRSSAAVATQAVSDLEGRIASSSAEIQRLQTKRSGLFATLLPSFGTDPADRYRERQLRDQRKADRQNLSIARAAAADASIALSQQRATEANDPRARARGDFDRAVGELNRQRRATVANADDPLYGGVVISEEQYQREFGRLAGLRDAAIEAASASGQKGRPPSRQRGSSARGVNALQGFGEGATEKVQRILEQYDPAPRGIDKGLQDLRELDRIIAELSKRRPPNFEATIASAEKAKTAVQEGLAEPISQITARFSDTPRDVAEAAAAMGDLAAIQERLQAAQPPNLDALLEQLNEARIAVQDSLLAPFREILTDQERSITLLQLAAEGRREEASQLEFIYGLMRQVGAESTAQLATELQKRGVTAAMVEQMLKNLAVEEQLADAAQRRLDVQRVHLQELDTFRGNIERFFADLPNRGLKAVGDLLGNIQGQASDYLARYLTETIFGGIFQQLEDQLSGRDQVRQANQAYVGEVGAVVTALRALEDAAYDAAAAQGGEIVVTGQREGELGGNPFDTRMKSPRELFGDILEPLLGKLGLGKDLAKDIGEKVGIALEGAAYGQMASSSILGSSGNKTTAAIGGALGQIAGEELGKVVGGTLGQALGPLGGIAGGVLFGAVGGLLKKAKYGTASLSGPEDISVTSRGAGQGQRASSLGGTVQSALADIAEALDAEIGAFQVSIGTYKDKLRVSTTGRTGKLKGKYSDVKDFGDDEAGALAFAIADAIGDGAVKGVSAAVQRALRSSEDVSKALEEALAVREVEDILAGLGDEYRKELKAFEKVAEERLRIGREYGFDLVALEKRNAEERAKLIDDILEDRVGSLKALLDDLSFGDLAEGSLAERRQKLLTEIGKAEDGAEKGDAGAADKLADLQRQLLELSYEAFGTAGGEYGSDRDQAVASAERIIKLEEERLKSAQAEVTGRLDQGNALASETNNLLSELLAQGRGAFGLTPRGLRDNGRGIETERSVSQ